MHSAIHSQLAQSNIDDLRRTAASRALHAEARHAADARATSRRSRAAISFRPSMVRRLVARAAS